MGEEWSNLEMAISTGDDLISVLDDGKGFHVLAQTLEHLKAIHFSCDGDFNQIHQSLQDLQRKIDACKGKSDEASSGTADDEEIERLQKELDEELNRECKLNEELRYTFMADEFKGMNSQGALIEGQRLAINRSVLNQLRTERKLSMYASVTKVIPNIHDPSKISGYMVDRDKRVIEKFEFDADNMTPYETCNSIWEVINKQ